jgi:hypothetical protein
LKYYVYINKIVRHIPDVTDKAKVLFLRTENVEKALDNYVHSFLTRVTVTAVAGFSYRIIFYCEVSMVIIIIKLAFINMRHVTLHFLSGMNTPTWSNWGFLKENKELQLSLVKGHRNFYITTIINCLKVKLGEQHVGPIPTRNQLLFLWWCYSVLPVELRLIIFDTSFKIRLIYHS